MRERKGESEADIVGDVVAGVVVVKGWVDV